HASDANVYSCDRISIDLRQVIRYTKRLYCIPYGSLIVGLSNLLPFYTEIVLKPLKRLDSGSECREYSLRPVKDFGNLRLTAGGWTHGIRFTQWLLGIPIGYAFRKSLVLYLDELQGCLTRSYQGIVVGPASTISAARRIASQRIVLPWNSIGSSLCCLSQFLD